jgi:hypothetical protein
MWTAIVVVFILGGPLAGRTVEFRQPAGDRETCQTVAATMIASLPQGLLAQVGAICVQPRAAPRQDRGV